MQVPALSPNRDHEGQELGGLLMLLLLLLFLNALQAGEGTQGRDPSSDISRTAMLTAEGYQSHLPILSSGVGWWVPRVSATPAPLEG